MFLPALLPLTQGLGRVFHPQSKELHSRAQD